jgi:uncharacterized protein (TIGR02145 family)
MITLFCLKKIRRQFMGGKKILLSILLVLLATTSGCIYDKVSEGGDDNPPPSPPVDAEIAFRINTTVENTPLNKQSMGSDEIGIYIYKDQSTIKNNIPVALNNGTQEFKIAEEDSLGYCFGYYPYSSSLISGTSYSGTLPPVRDQEVSTSSELPVSISNQLLMVSDQSNEINFKNQPVNIQFKNIFSLFCFKITKDVSLTPFDGQRLKHFKMYVSLASDTLTPLARYTLAGSYTINIKDASSSGDLTPHFSSPSSTIELEVTSNSEITSDPNTPIVVWVVVPPPIDLSFNKLVVRMETEDDNGISYHTISTFSRLGEIARNTLTTLSINLTKNSIYSDDVVKESFVDKPANSYVISEPGIYEIAAKKIGGEILDDGTSVDWLWASKEGGGSSFTIDELISNISFDTSGKTIQFHIGSDFGITKGNVILALKNESDEIVWTWHIWITDDKPKDIEYDTDFCFLDRNMGALSADTTSSAVNTYGFVYQWGRKDPFIGGGDDTFTEDESTGILSVARNNTIVNHSGVWGTDVNEWLADRSPEYGTIEQSVKYPMMFIYNSNSSSYEDPADWLSVSDPELWSDATKTAYDPCPYGYKIPSRNNLKILHKAFENSPPYPVFHNNSNRYWVYSYSGATTAWSLAGMREGRNAAGKWYGGQLKYSGTDNKMGHGYYWTSTPWDEDGHSVVPGASYNITMRDNILYEITYGPNADAYPVRCVKMANP